MAQLVTLGRWAREAKPAPLTERNHCAPRTLFYVRAKDREVVRACERRY